MAADAAAPPEPPAAPPGRRRAERPKLADGVELLGEFEDSGFKDPPHLARRGDGQVIQLTRLLHLVAEAADGQRDPAAMAEAVSERFGRRVSADNVRFLVDRKLRPLGVLARADGSSPRLKKADPLLALRHRTALVPSAATQRLARAFSPLHWAPVLAVLLAALLALDVYIFFAHGIGGGLRGALYEPAVLLALFAAVIVATAFHEIGHATACRYAGARPGVLGAGVYLVWPAFYCDVTDAYRLNRGGRLRTDLGGVYFNGVFSLLAGGAFLLTGFEPLVLVILSQHLIILQQLIPILRFDGYYVMSDLTGVPDILTRIKPILASLVPGREPGEKVRELKPWVRIVVTAYVALLVPVLIGLLVIMVMHAPRMFATAYDSMGLQLDRLTSGEGPATVALGVVQVVALALPCLAILVSVSRIGRRAGTGLRTWASGSAPRSALAVTGVGALVALMAWTWWPNGDYEPIRPGEKGTLGQAVSNIAQVPTGRPSFTEETERRFGAQPTVREREAVERGEDPGGGERPAGAEPVRPRDRGEGDATPTATPAPEAEATATPEPGAPAPTATPTPAPPAATATPEPTASATPEATATPTPTPVP